MKPARPARRTTAVAEAIGYTNVLRPRAVLRGGMRLHTPHSPARARRSFRIRILLHGIGTGRGLRQRGEPVVPRNIDADAVLREVAWRAGLGRECPARRPQASAVTQRNRASVGRSVSLTGESANALWDAEKPEESPGLGEREGSRAPAGHLRRSSSQRASSAQAFSSSHWSSNRPISLRRLAA